MAQLFYYTDKVKECKTKTKELWRVINRVFGKVKHAGSIISHISIDGLKTYNPKKIVNEFGKFYLSFGENLASKIVPESMTINEYLAKIPRVDANLTLSLITQPEIENIIKDLPNKTSHGHNKISNILPKQLIPCISFPLCAIFNQSLATGKFLNAMKKAEIIPLYECKEFDRVVNYRPVSLLITISTFLRNIRYYMIVSTDFEIGGPVSKQVWNW